VAPIFAAAWVAFAAFDAVFSNLVFLGRARHWEQGKGGAAHEHATKT
jgi:hypothetical protein